MKNQLCQVKRCWSRMQNLCNFPWGLQFPVLYASNFSIALACSSANNLFCTLKCAYMATTIISVTKIEICKMAFPIWIKSSLDSFLRNEFFSNFWIFLFGFSVLALAGTSPGINMFLSISQMEDLAQKWIWFRLIFLILYLLFEPYVINHMYFSYILEIILK